MKQGLLILSIILLSAASLYATPGDVIVVNAASMKTSGTLGGVLGEGQEFHMTVSMGPPAKEPSSGYMSTTPSTVLSEVRIRLGEDEISFPPNALHDLTNPHIHRAKIIDDYDQKYLLKISGADGGGAWRAKFTCTKSKLLEREVDANDRKASPIVTKY